MLCLDLLLSWPKIPTFESCTLIWMVFTINSGTNTVRVQIVSANHTSKDPSKLPASPYISVNILNYASTPTKTKNAENMRKNKNIPGTV